MVSMCKPFKNSLLIFCSLVGVMDASFIGFQSQIFWKPMSQLEILKIGRQGVGSKAFALQGDAGRCEFLPGYMLLHQGRW